MNPHARRNRTRPDRAAELRRIVGDDGEVVVTRSIDEIDEVARLFARAGIEVVGIAGGDGSVYRVLTAVRRAYGEGRLPALLPLRTGTINVIADSVGCSSGEPGPALARVVGKRRRGEPLDMTEAGTIEIDDDGLGFLFGIGLVVDFFRLYYETPDPRPASAVILLGRLVGSAVFGPALVRNAFPLLEARVESDGKVLPFPECSVVLGMAIEHLPLGFRPGYLANRTPGRFHLLAGSISPARISWSLPRFRCGLPVRDESLHDADSCDLRIEFGRPTHYMIDAEILGPVERLYVTSGPCVRFVLD